MLKFRTTKKVQTSLHEEITNEIEFRFRYSRDEETKLSVKCDAYRIEGSGVDEQTILIPGGGKYTDIAGAELAQLMLNAVQMTPPATEPGEALNYMDALVANGIKLYIVSNSLWKNQLTLGDFE